MVALKLTRRLVAKPWGRAELGPPFDVAGGERIGELWFEGPAGRDLPLLVKYLFTSERLSIQVHPDDTAAQAAGHPRGKDEAWVILTAAPDATIGLGTTRVASREELRAAALDGSIERLIAWRPVQADDVIYNAAGTVHAIGPGLTLIEVQQNVDLTYRLYDYGRPRELHLDEGVPVADPVPFVPPPVPVSDEPGRTILCEGGKFVMERWSWTGPRWLSLPDTPGWLIHVGGECTVDGTRSAAGACWLLEGQTLVEPEPGADLVFAYPLAERAALFA